MNRRLSFPVHIKINADWTKAINLFEKGLDILENRSELITKEYKFSDYGYHYEIAHNMSIAHVTNGSPDWYGTNGPLVLASMPWVKTMMEDMEELNPLFPSFNRLVGPGLEHVDQPTTLTALNYFIADGTAITTVSDGSDVETYPTKKDTGWLLDIQKPHRIDNTETRIWLNIRFGKPIDVCYNWFCKHPNLVYGD